MNSIESFKKYSKIEWTNEQQKLIEDLFFKLDELLLSCQEERSLDKINNIKYAHKIIHDINLSISIKLFLENN